MINFYVPDSPISRAINYLMADMRDVNPELFREDCAIKCAYGSMSATPFNGGRPITEHSTDKQMKMYLDEYKSRGIDYRFVFTNKFVEKKHLGDVYGNIQLSLAEEYKLGVIVHSEILEDYIRTNYPSIRLISSTTKLLSYTDTVKELENQNYDMVVINTALNRQLDNFDPVYRSKMEILVNDCCPPNCKNRSFCYDKAHMMNFGIDTYDYEVTEDNIKQIDVNHCTNKDKLSLMNDPKLKLPYEARESITKLCDHISIDRIRELNKLGYCNFKLNGREKQLHSILFDYMDYFVHRKYHTRFFIDVSAIVYV